MSDSIAKKGFQVERLAKRTLQDHVYKELCELILDGEIAPGQLVTIQALADAFGVSAMPVREALQRLTAARVLTVISGRSIGIPPLTTDRMEDLKRVRLEVEGLAAEWAAERIEDGELRALGETLRSMEEAVRTGSRKEFVRLNHAFHFAIYAAAGSEALMAIIENLWLQVSPYFHLLHGSGNYMQANEQHEIVLNALRARDGTRAREGIRNDIEAASRVLSTLLDDRG